MGSYISIGCVCDAKIQKKNFLEIAKNTILKRKENICNLRANIPNNNYSEWNSRYFSVNEVLNFIDVCFKDEMAEILFDLKTLDIEIKDIITKVEKIEKDSYAIIFYLPEESFNFISIDNLENNIKKQMLELIKLGFDYIYCDNEAGMKYKISDVINNDNLYSILVYDDKIHYAGWKIDGLTQRENG